MHCWIRGLFSLMAFLAVFLVGEGRNMDMSFVVGHELCLVLGRSVSHKQKSSCLSWGLRPWSLRNSLPIFTASFNESYQNQDRIQDFLGWLPSFPWLGDFGFSFLKSPSCAAELNPGKGRDLHPLECKRLIANGNNTQLTRFKARNRLWYQCEWKDNVIPGFPGWCGVCGSLYPPKVAHCPAGDVLLTWFMCDIFEEIEEYFENPGPDLVSSTCSLCSSVFWDNLRDNWSGSHRMLCWKRGLCCHILWGFCWVLRNRPVQLRRCHCSPREGHTWSSCLNLASHLY